MSTDAATPEITTSPSATPEGTSLSDSLKKWNPNYGSRSSMKIEIKSFGEKINFGLWQRPMYGILLQQLLQISLLGIKKKSEDMTDAEWMDIDEREISSIEAYVTDVIKSCGNDNHSQGHVGQARSYIIGEILIE